VDLSLDANVAMALVIAISAVLIIYFYWRKP